MNFQVVTFIHRSDASCHWSFFYLVDSLVVNDLILYFNICPPVGPFTLFFLATQLFGENHCKQKQINSKHPWKLRFVKEKINFAATRNRTFWQTVNIIGANEIQMPVDERIQLTRRNTEGLKKPSMEQYWEREDWQLGQFTGKHGNLMPRILWKTKPDSM